LVKLRTCGFVRSEISDPASKPENFVIAYPLFNLLIGRNLVY
jgi:hypothetical protein